MLKIQEYLRNGKTLEELKEEWDIGASHHPTLPIFNLNYGLETQKTSDLSLECRSLCLDRDYNLVARAFPRFFNLHEALEINDKFNWDFFEAFSKEDGSLIKLFFYDGQWVVSTRSGFGDNTVNNSEVTYEELFFKVFNRDDLYRLDKKNCYVFEICSPLCKVVRQYTDTKIYLLAIFAGEIELSDTHCDIVASSLGLNRPERYRFKSPEEVYSFIRQKEEEDKTYEGVVLKDSNNLRIKVKSSTYVALHRLRGEGNNIISPKYIIPLILSGEDEEVLENWSEFREHYDKIRDRLDLHCGRVCDLWDKVKDIEDQKEFALSIKNETPFAGLLFSARKTKIHPKKLWRDSADLIYKVLYRK